MRAYSSSSARRRGRQYQASRPTTSSTTQTMKIGRKLIAKSNQCITTSSLREVGGVDFPELHLGAEHLEIGKKRVHLGRAGGRPLDRLEDRCTRIAREHAAGIAVGVQLRQLVRLGLGDHLVGVGHADRAIGREMLGDALSV